MSPSKRQASQRKPFALSSVSAQTSSHLRKHRTSVPSRPQKLPGALIRTKSAPQTLPQPHPHSLPTPKSHVIPPGPHSPVARKPRNINDLISKPETLSGELRAKLLSTCHGSTSWSPPRGLADTTQHRRCRRCGGRRRVRRARAGFEIDHSEPLGSRVAISRAAGPDGARNTSGTTSNAGDLAGPQPQQAAPRAAAAQ